MRVELDYLDVGCGKPVVLLPGMEGAKEFWERQWPELSQRYRVIACSYARRRLRLDWRMSDYAEEIVAIMDELDLDRAAVVAESFGGLVAQELATSWPDRVVALVLCNTFDRVRYEHVGLNMFTVASALHPLAFALPRPWRLPMLEWVGKHRGFVMDPSPGNRDLAAYILEHGMDPGVVEYLNRMLAGRHADYRNALGTLRIPVLVLRGEEDRVVGEATVASFLEHIPNVDLARIEGGGHCCQYTKPDTTNQALLEWFDRVGY